MIRLVSLAAFAALAITSACTNPAHLSGSAASGSYAGGTSNPSSPEYFRETVGDRVLFPVDQSTLTAEARSVLDGQARWLAQNPGYSATIEGHADEQGTREYNLALGARRAASVSQYLVSQGVAAHRLRSVSFGKERPIEVCSTEICYAQNRRAVTAVALNPGS